MTFSFTTLFFIALLAIFAHVGEALVPSRSGVLASNVARKSIVANCPSSKLHALPNLNTLFISDGGLDPETLESLGDIQDLNEALDGAIDNANPAISILTKLVASPLVLAVPIGAGVLVAFLVGFFIFSYGQGRDD
jgi:hypothetical protein